MRSRRFSVTGKFRQIGLFSIDMSLALLISALAAGTAYVATMRANDNQEATSQGTAMAALRGAAHKLVMDNYLNYQSSLDVTEGGVTLPFGTGTGQSDNFTVANLSSMNIGVNNASSTGTYKSLTNVTYKFSISRSAICATTPGDVNCHVTGLVCLPKPVKAENMANGEVDTPAISAMLRAIGTSGGASLIGNGSTLASEDGSWTMPNPYGNLPGIVCARYGYGSEDDQYLRVADTRDPNFKGGETLSGVIASNAGGYTLQVNGTSNLTGNTTIGDAATKTGDLSIGNSVTIGGAGSPGSACTVNGSMVWGSIAGTPTLLQCVSNIWTASGMPLGVDGAACTTEGKLAITAAGTNLVCRAGFYRQLSDMVGQGGLTSIALYGQGAVVPTPTCTGVNMTPHLFVMGVVSACTIGGGACPNDTGAFFGQIGAGNVVSILGSDGSSQAGAQAQIAVASMCATY